MEKTRREIMDRVYLTYLPAKKFKTGCLSAPQVVILPIKSYLRREVLYRWVGDEPAVMPAVPVISSQLHARYSADLLQLLGVAPIGGG